MGKEGHRDEVWLPYGDASSLGWKHEEGEDGGRTYAFLVDSFDGTQAIVVTSPLYVGYDVFLSLQLYVIELLSQVR